MSNQLRQHINNLNSQNKQQILDSIESLYQQCKVLNSDEFVLNDQNEIVSAEKKMRAETIVSIVNDYQDCKKPINMIMQEKGLTAFDIISALCEYVFKQQNTVSRLVDFTEAIHFMYVDQESLVHLIDFLLKNPDTKLSNVIGEMLCLPSLCMLMLTLIWIELKNPKMADLFDRNWEKPNYKAISQTEFKELDEEIQKAFDEYARENTASYSNNLSIGQLEEYLQMTREVVSDRTKVLNETMKTIQELDNIINNQSLNVEMVISDSSDSDAPQENDEICVLVQKISEKWLNTNLTHELLASEIVVKESLSYLTNFTSFIEDNKVMDTYVVCRMIEKKGDGVFIMQSATKHLREVRICELAMNHAPKVRCPEGTRVVALYKKNSNDPNGYWLPGTVGVKPLIQNHFEYLIFFDNGIDSYVSPKDICLMLEQPLDPTTKRFEPREAYTFIRNVAKQNFIKKYLQAFPDWPLIRLKKSENTMRVLTKREGREESAFVLDVNRQMCLLRFPSQRIGPSMKTGRDCVIINCKEHNHIDEWVYRGNSDRFPTLLSSTEPTDLRTSARRLGRVRSRFEMALPEYDPTLQQKLETIEMSTETNAQGRSIQTARKSSRRQVLEMAKTMNLSSSLNADLITRRKMSNKIRFEQLVPPNWSHLPYKAHKTCSSKCINIELNTDLKSFQPCSPYFIPLVFGWTRESRKVKTYSGRGDNSRVIIVYRAPCGMRFLRIKEVAKYLKLTGDERLTIDLFSFELDLRPNVIAKPFREEHVLMDDFAHGLEDVKIPVLNAVNDEKVPTMTYRARRFADSVIIDGSVQPQFCSGCTCTDNCSDPNKCECQQLTILSNDRLSASLQNRSKTYQNRSLSEKIISAVYECNDMCSCSKKLCYNRVVQQNIKIPMQLYMTAETGWGVRTLVDIPAGTFISTYSGRLLTDRMADIQGREVSDMYLAELDLHDSVEAEKQAQGIDLIDTNYDEGIGTDEEFHVENVGPSSSIKSPKLEPEEMSFIDKQYTCYDSFKVVKLAVLNDTPSTSAEVKQFNFGDYFGDNSLFIVDAQESGNIGRFLNHSCDPNVFVQMVMVDTHDLRLPWVAFFAEKFVKAGEELRWNYGYCPNSVPGKVLICKCGSMNCQGRLL